MTVISKKLSPPPFREEEQAFLSQHDLCTYKVQETAKSILRSLYDEKGVFVSREDHLLLVATKDLTPQPCLTYSVSLPSASTEKRQEEAISIWEKSLIEATTARPNLPSTGKLGSWLENAANVWDFGKDSEGLNPIRDKIVSGGAYVGLLGEVSALVGGAIPGLVLVSVGDIVGTGAKSLEEQIQALPPMPAFSGPPGVGSEMISFEESKLVVEMILKTLQMPQKAFDAAHQFLETHAISFCDKTNLTEKRILNLVRELVFKAEPIGPIPF
jgi:hypothetical protein